MLVVVALESRVAEIAVVEDDAAGADFVDGGD